MQSDREGVATGAERPTLLVDIMDALDMPEELVELQNAYWEARREWQRLDVAYRTVAYDVLERLKRG